MKDEPTHHVEAPAAKVSGVRNRPPMTSAEPHGVTIAARCDGRTLEADA